MALAGGACCVRPSAAHFQCDAFCSSRDTGLQQLTTGTHWQPTSVRAFTACSACSACVFQSGRMWTKRPTLAAVSVPNQCDIGRDAELRLRVGSLGRLVQASSVCCERNLIVISGFADAWVRRKTTCSSVLGWWQCEMVVKWNWDRWVRHRQVNFHRVQVTRL